MGNRTELEDMGKRILNASRTELYLSMRFLGPALHSLGFVMDLSTTGVGTDAAYLRFNPNYLFRLYVERPRMLNRAYLHMLLHCVFRHMFTAREKEDRELWDLACDIAVESIIDSMEYGAVAQLTPERRQRVYDLLTREIRVLTAERIYQFYLERKRNYLEELQLRAMFSMCDHSFWERMEDEEGDEAGDGTGGDHENARTPGEKIDSEKKGEEGEKGDNGDPDAEAGNGNRAPSDENRNSGENRGSDDKERSSGNDGNNSQNSEKEGREERSSGKRNSGNESSEKGGRDGKKRADGRQKKERQLRSLRPLGDLRDLEEHWKDASKRMEAEILSSGKEASDERGSLDRILAISNRARTDYREFLRKFAVLREVTTIDPDSFDYGFYNYGLEVYGNMPLIEENEYCELNRIRTLVIAIDTSASCQEVLVQRFLNETAAVLRNIGQFFHSSEVHIIECDEHVQQEVVVHSLEDLEKYAGAFHVKGGFGTDFRPVFAYVEEKRKRGEIKDLEGLMYFTDGMGIYPEKPTDYDTAFVFFNDEELDDTKVPDWAVRLYIADDRVKRKL